MKTRKFPLIVGVLVLSLVVSACGNSKGNMDMGNSSTSESNSPSSSDSGTPEEVSVVASNWKWDLSNTEFKVGETITFSIQGKEGAHGFAIEGTEINENIAPGQTKTVTWTPDKAGDYTIACSVACGTGHNDMVQKITVSE